MKKEYKQPVYLDTCIAKNILGFDDNSEIERLYNKDKLLKYIKHHGCVFTVFTMFEILRDEKLDIDSSMLDNLHSLNYEIFVYDEMGDADFTSNYKEEIYDKAKRETFVAMVNAKVIIGAAEYYACILAFPFVFLVCQIEEWCGKHSIKIEHNKLNEIIGGVISSISKQLNEMFQSQGIFKKSVALKVLNSVYKWIYSLTIEWFYGEMNEICKDAKKGNIYKTCELYLDKINQIDFNQKKEYENLLDKDTKKENQPIYATGELNFFLNLEEMGLKLMDENVGFKYNADKLSQEEFRARFVQLVDNYVHKIYKIDDNTVRAKYLTENIHDFFLDHIRDFKGNFNLEKTLKSLVDPNDWIDLLSLEFVEKQGMIFLTTDGMLKRMIRKIYKEDRIQIFNDFIY